MKTYSGSVPAPYTAVSLPWNFTTASGAAYTGTAYTVSFTSSSTTLTITNYIDRVGVRPAAANILTYSLEDPTNNPLGLTLNTQANTWVPACATLYASLYSSDFASQTQYSPGDIGPNRDQPRWATMPLVDLPGSELAWGLSMAYALTNSAYSDFTFYCGHGDGTEIGGNAPDSHYYNLNAAGHNINLDSGSAQNFSSVLYQGWPNWRLRKVALWACYTMTPQWTRAAGTYPAWQTAFGIRATHQQLVSGMKKNVGLFMLGQLPQAGYPGTIGGSSAEVACDFDLLWVEGPNGFPGGCDPTYAFSWALDQTITANPPLLSKGVPLIVGFHFLPYTGIYDMELMTNYIGHVKY